MFVSLGVGKNQIPLLIALKNKQIPIIGIDQNEHAPGRNNCDFFYQSSILDKKNILEILEPHKDQITGVYSRSFGEAVFIANQIAMELKVPSNPEEALRLFQNKNNILDIALQYGDLKEQLYLKNNLHEAKKWIIRNQNAYQSYAKKNIFIAEDWKVVERYLNNSDFIVEPFYEGKEYIFFGFIIERELYPLIITQKETIFNDEELLFCDECHFFPNDLSYKVKFKIFQISNYIIKKTNLHIGPFLAEFIVNDDKIFFIEAVPEVGGEFICDILIPEVCGIPYFEILIDIYTNNNYEKLKDDLYHLLIQPKRKSMIIQYVLQSNGTFKYLRFPEELFLSKYYYYHEVLKKENTILIKQNKNLDRVALFVLSGETSIDMLKKEVSKIYKNIKIEYSNIL